VIVELSYVGSSIMYIRGQQTKTELNRLPLLKLLYGRSKQI